MTHIELLESLGACRRAVEWAKNYPDMQSAWDACERGDWMLWLWAELEAGEPWSDKRIPLVLAACECARLSLVHVPAGELRPLRAIETVESWARGEHGDRHAVSAASWASLAASSAASDAARNAVLADCAAIVRRYHPLAPWTAGGAT